MARTEKHSIDAEHDKGSRWEGANRGKIFYKQPVNRDRRRRASRKGSLEGRSYHWHLDVTFREDGNHTLEKQASYNLNIMRKLSISILKMIEVGNKTIKHEKETVCNRNKPRKHLEQNHKSVKLGMKTGFS